MNLSTLRSHVIAELDEVAGEYFTNDEVDYWLNQGQYDIYNKVKPEQSTHTETTVAETKNYTLPADYMEMFMLIYNGDTRLEEVSLEEAKEETYDNGYYYYIWGDTYYLTFDPDGEDIVLYYYPKPDEMSSDSDTPDIDAEYQDLLIKYAVYRAKYKDTKYQEAQVVWNEYMVGVQDMKGRYSHKPARKQWKVQRR